MNIEVFVQDGSGGLISSAVYTMANSEKIRIADLNNDGLLDVVGGATDIDVFYQNAGGTLNAPVTYSFPLGSVDDLKIGDVNNDGLLDIIIMNDGFYPTQLDILTQSTGTFNASVYLNSDYVFPGGVAVGDVTGDGKQDVVETYGGNFGRIDVFAQNGVGSLNTATTYSSYDIPEPVEIAVLMPMERRMLLFSTVVLMLWECIYKIQMEHWNVKNSILYRVRCIITLTA